MPKYAQFERERKFLISPDTIKIAALRFKKIRDYYVEGTSLRLRIMTDDQETKYKLTQKRPTGVNGESQITTIYLNQHEFSLFNTNPVVVVEKTRYLLPYGDYIIALDHYQNEKEELWPAEVEFKSLDEMNRFEMPIPFINEVTHHPEYNGYELALRFKQR